MNGANTHRISGKVAIKGGLRHRPPNPMRDGATDAQLADIIRGVWSVRADRYSEQRASLTDELRARRKKVEMYHIGG